MPPLGLRLLQGSEEIRSKSSTIEKDLAVICRNVPNVNQLAVFERAVQQVEKALGKSRDAEMGNLEAILKMVKEEVVKKRGNYQECRIVLEKGSELLRSLLASKRRYREKIKKLYEEEKKAIEEDHIYETDQKEHPILWTHLQIQTMEQSEQQQSTCIDVDGMFGTYGDVAWHLQTQGMVHLPELWIRCEGDGFQRITDSGYWWDRVRGTDSIKVPLIYAMSRNHVGDYHVILVHEGNKEFPMVLNLPVIGTTCCRLVCPSLGKHLVRLWNDRYRICRILRIRDPEQDVFDVRLDSVTFQNQENDIYVRREGIST